PAEVLPEGRDAAKVTPGHVFIHHCYRRRTRVIAFGEFAADGELDSHRLEEVRRDTDEMTLAPRRGAIDVRRIGPAHSHEQTVRGKRRGADAGNRRALAKDLTEFVEQQRAFESVPRRSDVCDQNPTAVESGILVQEVLQGSDKQAGSYQHHEGNRDLDSY